MNTVAQKDMPKNYSFDLILVVGNGLWRAFSSYEPPGMLRLADTQHLPFLPATRHPQGVKHIIREIGTSKNKTFGGSDVLENNILSEIRSQSYIAIFPT